MGNSNKRTIFYFGATFAVLFLMALWPSKKSSSFLGFSAWKNIGRAEQQDDSKVIVSPYSNPRSRWKSRKPVDGKESTNDYQPGENYVNSYVPNTEYQHPLVASTTFVNKKDQKKNKSKKKKEELAKTAKDSQSTRRYGLSETPDTGDSHPQPNPPATIGATTPAPNSSKNTKSNQEEEENLNTVEYWEEPIFVDLNTGMVSKLIESYQGRKVSAGVFYELVTEMRTDERTQVREFGLVALSSTPSTRSFAELASMKNTDTDTNLRNAASREVSSYYQEARLSHVISALSIKNAVANRPTYEALAVLNDATKKYSGESTQGSTPGSAPASVTASATVDARFEQALTVIEQNKLTESPDSRVKNQAVRTQSSLEKFLTATL